MKQRKPRSHQRRPSATGQPSGTLRVIGGSLRGRPIQYLGDPRTRPMKQRVREAAFNLLGGHVAGAHVIDLFAGTGALTWEAISRGARSATLVERHFPSARVLRENASALGLLPQVEVVTADTFFWGRTFAPHTLAAEPRRPWLVFCSPPYELFVSHTEPLLELMVRLIQEAPPGSCFVVEADDRFDMARLPASISWDIRRYPPAVLAVAQTSASL